MRDEPEIVILDEARQRRQERAAFNATIEAALDRSSEALRALIHEGGPLLSPGERELLQELVFKLGMARSAMIEGDGDPADIDDEWCRAKAWCNAAAEGNGT